MRRWLAVSLITLAACAPRATRAPEAQVETGSTTSAPEIVPIPEFREAIAAGTRTTTGAPGPNYWQNSADYVVRLRVVPDSLVLHGSETIRYRNASPDALAVIVLDLTLNIHEPDAVRLEPAEPTGGVELHRVTLNGQPIPAGAVGGGAPAYQVDGTKLIVRGAAPVAAGSTADLAIDWSVPIPQAGASGRMGHDRDNLIFLAYFYPQVSVYDDVIGWHPDQFLGTAEFYGEFASYDVTVEAPADWLVLGTGRLGNPDEVLAPAVAARLRTAEGSDDVVHVVTASDFGKVTRAGTGWQRWSFSADSVHDVAFSLTRESLWDAARTPVGDRDGDGSTDFARVDAIYRQSAPLWAQSASHAQHAVRFLSEFTGIDYPWPHMTVVEGAGIIGGGMEYPMMSLIGDYTSAGAQALYDVTAHEIGHMWVPMIVASDERRYGWLDEGTTNFNEHQARLNHTPGAAAEIPDRTAYLNVARRGLEGEIMRRSDYHYSSTAYVTATYYKPATMLATLSNLLGEESFLRAYRTFLDRWKFKHPYPWDMWNTFEEVTGKELDWFWESWYFGTGVLDQAVESVTVSSRGSEVVVRSLGDNPMPAIVRITLADGSTLDRTIPVTQWFGGTDRVAFTLPGVVTKVEIDPENLFPDADRENNVWGN